MKARQIAMAVAVAILSGLLLTAAAPSARAQAGAPWGIDSGRATDADVFNSVSDFIALKAARDKLQSGVLDQIAAERQKELLGTAPDKSLLATLAPQLGKQFLDSVFPVALRLTKNPAVPCEVAGNLAGDLLSSLRQQQLLGTGIGDVNDAATDAAGKQVAFDQSAFGQMFAAVKERCLEDAFDACMLTGNGRHVSVDLIATERLLGFYGIPSGDFAARGAYLFRRCTVYELRNHSVDTIDGAESSFGSAQDGKVLLLADVAPDPTATFGGLEGGHKWEGPRDQDPIDVKETTTDCHSKSQYVGMSCAAVTVPYAAHAEIDAGAFSMVRNFTVAVLTDAGVKYTGGRDGSDALTLQYRPATALRPMTITTPVITTTNPLNISSAAFGVAFEDTQGQLGDHPITDWQRGTYPVLFTGKISGSKQPGGSSVFTDTTTFQLVHCPGKFPADQVNAGYELPLAPKLPKPGSGSC